MSPVVLAGEILAAATILVESGKLIRRLTLDSARDADHAIRAGEAKGKLVVDIA